MPRSRSLPLVGDIPLYEGDLERDLAIVSRGWLAEQITGGLSQTSKLPCPSWGISATRCKVGSVLAQEKGTVCNRCYAMKGRYSFDNVQNKLEERYRGLFSELWTPSMVFLVNYFCNKYFRLFDSGDLQGVSHLKNILTMALHTPGVQIWMPTREIETVRQVQDEIGAFPDNLVVRVSAHRIDGQPPRGFQNTSTVIAIHERDGYTCPSPDQKNSCGDCRACWNLRVRNVEYWLH